MDEQECIPVGCVPPAAVTVRGGPPQCMLGCNPLGVGLKTPLGVGSPAMSLQTIPGVGLETPPGQTPQLLPWVWAWRPPPARSLNFPLGVGLETCKACWDTPQRPAARHAGIPPAMHAGIPPIL